MYTNAKLKNHRGFTLVEIIASIAILGIVIAVFLPIFPQMMSWTNKTDDELVASNLLGQVASDINNPDKNEKIIAFAQSTPECLSGTQKKIPEQYLGDIESYKLNGNAYHITLYVCEEGDVDDLYRTHIEINSANHEKVSESYTYIRRYDEGEEHG